MCQHEEVIVRLLQSHDSMFACDVQISFNNVITKSKHAFLTCAEDLCKYFGQCYLYVHCITNSTTRVGRIIKLGTYSYIVNGFERFYFELKRVSIKPRFSKSE